MNGLGKIRHSCIMSPWLFSVYMDAVMRMGRRVSFMEEGRESILPVLLYTDDLVLCGESGQWWEGLLRYV